MHSLDLHFHLSSFGHLAMTWHAVASFIWWFKICNSHFWWWLFEELWKLRQTQIIIVCLEFLNSRFMYCHVMWFKLWTSQEFWMIKFWTTCSKGCVFVSKTSYIQCSPFTITVRCMSQLQEDEFWQIHLAVMRRNNTVPEMNSERRWLSLGQESKNINCES